MASPRICLVIPYFGRWPFWMPFFLESCRYNPSIDWLLLSDCGVPEDCPSNVHVREISFSSYCSLVSARLNIDFSPSSPYKLCDLKPALGYIHESELAGYEFWGFGDIDLVYGDLRRYFSDQRLQRYDLLSTHERRISGHLCLLRNDAQMRNAFMRVPDWQSKLAFELHLAFDEKAFSRLFVRGKNWPGPIRSLRDKLNTLRRRSEFLEAFSTPYTRIRWTDGSMQFPRRWIWSKGSLRTDLDGEREFPYFHFITWKNTPWGGLSESERIGSPDLAREGCWSISEQGFHPC
ncbi:DUF6625 family protein [Pseudomonas oligotrophica]|uniref:DUF6625 family protein n=1 Tax=Pseudomonas oligotrophica TaxID=2912055 RepID=UPI001F25CA54|nr:DUF6625 family protein [Pseudomonas oligotrophica]MCF7201103.1 hypothetical protein [Pseudomonas oligotrophica]